MNSFSSFRGSHLLLFTVVIALALAVAWILTREHPEDSQFYTHLMTTVDKNHATNSSAPYTAKQEREGIQKTLLLHQGSRRLQLRITADAAKLVFDRHDSATEVIEQMQKVSCCWQEELYYLLADGREAIIQGNGKLLIRGANPQYSSSWIHSGQFPMTPMQSIATLTADEAAYYYSREILVAKEVSIARYKLQGHGWKDQFNLSQPLMTGKAQEVGLNMAGNAPKLDVQKLQAVFQPSENEIAVASNSGVYDGSDLVLQGQVLVESSLGCLKADSVELRGSSGSKAWNQAFLHDNVAVQLKDRGEITSGKAMVNLASGEAIFSGNSSQRDVVYIENELQNPSSPLLLIKSQELLIEMAKESGVKGSSVSTLTASENVFIDYKGLFQIVADQGIYTRCEATSASPGIILSPSPENEQCKISTPEGDAIYARRIHFDLSTQKLSLITPKGTIERFSPQGSPLDFSCNLMTWNAEKGLLNMQGSVLLNQKGLGTISNHEEIAIQKGGQPGHQSLQWFKCLGETELTYNNDADKTSHQLTCYGLVIGDLASLNLSFESPRDSAGNVIKGRQLFFHDRLGEFYADDAVVHYLSNEKEGFIPSSITLKGNVSVMKRTTAHPGDEGQLLQYVLADKVDYELATKTFHFSADKSRRVLLFDKLNNIKVSAQGVEIKKDPKTGEEIVQGNGDVRLQFAETEFEQLRKRFAFDKDTK